MQKTKKQKHEQEIRKNLKTILNLQPELVQFLKQLPLKNESLLTRSYPNIHKLQLLRIFTLLEINFIIFSFIDIIQRTKALKFQNLKIGVIGGGVMGRLILNTLLVFTKQGLNTSNIMISTRQPQHLQFYAQNFGIKTFFDNQKIAQQADLIFVATPATLDNWIIVDLKNNIQSRTNISGTSQSIRTSYASTVIAQNSQPVAKTLSSGHNSIEISKRGENQTLLANKTVKKPVIPVKQEPITLNPFIYILTSDFTEEKCNKLFNFPVMKPWLRVTDLPSIIQILKQKLESHTTQSLSQNPESIIKQLESAMAEWLSVKTDEKQSSQLQNSLHSFLHQKDKITQALDFSCKKLETHWKKEIAFSKTKNQLELYEIHKLCNQALQSHGSFAETFLTKSRKWRMAHNNFIA